MNAQHVVPLKCLTLAQIVMENRERTAMTAAKILQLRTMTKREVTLDYATIKAIASEVAKIIKRDELPELVTTEQAASILGISPARMRQIKDKFPHVKKGTDKQGKLLFSKKALFLPMN